MNTQNLNVGDTIEVFDWIATQPDPEWVPARIVEMRRKDGSDGFRATASTTSNGLPIEYDFSHRTLSNELEFGSIRAKVEALIAMHGEQGAGKDSVGKILVEQHGFTRLSFAERLRQMCLALDPAVWIEPEVFRLSDAVNLHGWDQAKKLYPEVRRIQQVMGTEVIRDMVDPDYWIKHVESQIKPGGKYVITDLRFPNEAEMVSRLGGEIWWVQRTGNDYEQSKDHVSESWHPERYRCIVNDSDLAGLADAVAFKLVEAATVVTG